MARYAAPPTASPSPSASSLVITTPAPSPLRARAALTVTGAPPSGGGPRRMQCASSPPATVIAMTADRYALAREAAAAVAARTGGGRHDPGAGPGSGWAGAADALGEVVAELDVGELPGFLPPVAQGHAGRLRSTRLGGRAVLVVLGRTHLYEGHGPGPVVHAVRAAAAAGCRTAVLTNASGAIRQELAPGSGVVLRDHLDLAAAGPLAGPRFVDLTDAYAPRLRRLPPEAGPAPPAGRSAVLPR